MKLEMQRDECTSPGPMLFGFQNQTRKLLFTQFSCFRFGLSFDFGNLTNVRRDLKPKELLFGGPFLEIDRDRGLPGWTLRASNSFSYNLDSCLRSE